MIRVVGGERLLLGGVRAFICIYMKVHPAAGAKIAQQ